MPSPPIEPSSQPNWRQRLHFRLNFWTWHWRPLKPLFAFLLWSIISVQFFFSGFPPDMAGLGRTLARNEISFDPASLRLCVEIAFFSLGPFFMAIAIVAYRKMRRLPEWERMDAQCRGRTPLSANATDGLQK